MAKLFEWKKEGVQAMTESEVRFCLLCGTLEDAVELIDAGKLEMARALLSRTLEEARRVMREEKF